MLKSIKNYIENISNNSKKKQSIFVKTYFNSKFIKESLIINKIYSDYIAKKELALSLLFVNIYLLLGLAQGFIGELFLFLGIGYVINLRANSISTYYKNLFQKSVEIKDKIENILMIFLAFVQNSLSGDPKLFKILRLNNNNTCTTEQRRLLIRKTKVDFKLNKLSIYNNYFNLNEIFDNKLKENEILLLIRSLSKVDLNLLKKFNIIKIFYYIYPNSIYYSRLATIKMYAILEFLSKKLAEWNWTVIPAIMVGAVVTESSEVIYEEDKPFIKIGIALNGGIQANQWYWVFNYVDIKNYTEKKIESYMLANDFLEEGLPRLLLTTNEYVTPSVINSRFFVTSIDVIHSFALSMFGVKVDAMPGRLNQLFYNAVKVGAFMGQCSELCGVNHGYMPILFNNLSLKEFLNFLDIGFYIMSLKSMDGFEVFEKNSIKLDNYFKSFLSTNPVELTSISEQANINIVTQNKDNLILYSSGEDVKISNILFTLPLITYMFGLTLNSKIDNSDILIDYSFSTQDLVMFSQESSSIKFSTYSNDLWQTIQNLVDPSSFIMERISDFHNEMLIFLIMIMILIIFAFYFNKGFIYQIKNINYKGKQKSIQIYKSFIIYLYKKQTNQKSIIDLIILRLNLKDLVNEKEFESFKDTKELVDIFYEDLILNIKEICKNFVVYLKRNFTALGEKLSYKEIIYNLKEKN